MNQEHLSKLFGSIGIIALVTTVNTWIQIQGGETVLSMPLLSKEHPAAALYALVLVGALLSLTAVIGLVHAVRFGAQWHERIPLVWLAGLKTGTTEGRLYQGVILFLLIVLPAASLLKFWDAVMSARLCNLGSTAPPSPASDVWSTGTSGWTSQIRLVAQLVQGPNPSAPEGCAGGIEVFPPMEFILIMGLDIAAALGACTFLVAVLRPRASEPLPSMNE